MLIHLDMKGMSDCIVYDDADNFYQDGDLLVIDRGSVVESFPIANVYRITEYIEPDDEVI